MSVRLLTAKLRGTCRKCWGVVAVGDRILWEPGSAQHEDCTGKEHPNPEGDCDDPWLDVGDWS